jgi:hypothetical protein
MDTERDASTAELIAAVLAAPEDREDGWQPSLQEWQNRPTRETFDAAIRLLASDAMRERVLGVEILGQLGGSGSDQTRPFREESVLALLEVLTHEREPRVLESLGFAFSHLGRRLLRRRQGGGQAQGLKREDRARTVGPIRGPVLRVG